MISPHKEIRPGLANLVLGIAQNRQRRALVKSCDQFVTIQPTIPEPYRPKMQDGEKPCKHAALLKIGNGRGFKIRRCVRSSFGVGELVMADIVRENESRR